jgi:hypothetical protein
MNDQQFERKEKARLDAMYDAQYSDEPTESIEYEDRDSKPIKMIPSKKALSAIVLAYYGIIALLSVYFAWLVMSKVSPKLPCAVSEISPDFSHADREKCRLMRNHKL